MALFQRSQFLILLTTAMSPLPEHPSLLMQDTSGSGNNQDNSAPWLALRRNFRAASYSESAALVN
ncbi:MAG: hypothetical protein CMK71_17760 [Pseudomonadaceae bacterium]|nr:hypothetical protein [Pseudomonadaceae bacterium]|tara:strand:+ start:334 stop:528 length:195 start_codon:yes stop_codon:yes gene_type:complete